MANHTKITLAVAKKLRPDVFKGYGDEYSQTSASYAQEQLFGVVKEVLLALEKCGYRVLDPLSVMTPLMVETGTRMRLDGKTIEEIVVTQLLMIKPLFPAEEIHNENYRKYFKKLRHGKRGETLLEIARRI